MFFCLWAALFCMYRCGAAGTSSCVQRALLSTPRRWRGVLLAFDCCATKNFVDNWVGFCAEMS